MLHLLRRLLGSASATFAALFAAGLLAACSQKGPAGGSAFENPSQADGSVAVSDPGLGGVDSGAGDDSGLLGGWHPGADAGDGAAASPDAGTPVVDTVSASVGPIEVMPNEETTVCITLRLSNAAAAYVPRITVQLAPGSHHLVVYRSMATTENLTPTPCTAFQGILSGDAVPLMISEKPADDLTFPEGVALKIAPQQMIELEAHYINTSATTIEGHGSVQFETVPVTTTNVIESDLAFWGTLGIVLPPGAATVGPLFAAGISGTHGFALTTHQHRLGKEFRIWYGSSATDTNHAPVADTTDWANAPLYRVNPEMDFNGSNGLAYQCDWNNTTGQVVTFGESALQEMCFLWMYYYPSHGFDMRFQ